MSDPDHAREAAARAEDAAAIEVWQREAQSAQEEVEHWRERAEEVEADLAILRKTDVLAAALESEREHRRFQVAKLEAEIERLKHDYTRVSGPHRYWQDRAEAAEAERDKLREELALLKIPAHPDSDKDTMARSVHAVAEVLEEAGFPEGRWSADSVRELLAERKESESLLFDLQQESVRAKYRAEAAEAERDRLREALRGAAATLQEVSQALSIRCQKDQPHDHQMLRQVLAVLELLAEGER